jgi:hypothetical protein
MSKMLTSISSTLCFNSALLLSSFYVDTNCKKNEEIGKFSLYNYGSILAIKTFNTILFNSCAGKYL